MLRIREWAEKLTVTIGQTHDIETWTIPLTPGRRITGGGNHPM